MELVKLFLLFAKIGVCTFGGGYAMLPILEREIVEKRGWVESSELMDYYAVAQCTPGVIAVNVATFIGRKRCGILGGFFATLGVVFPSIVIIGIIAAFIGNVSDNPYVRHALAGIRIAVCAIVSVSIYKICRKGIVDLVSAAIALLVLVGTAFLGVSPAIAVVAAAVTGLVAGAIRAKDTKPTVKTDAENDSSKGGEGK